MNRKELLARMQSIVDKAKSEVRDLTEDEQREMDDLQRQFDSIKDDGDGDDQTKQERQRVCDITDLCRGFDINPDTYIREGKTLEEVRALVLEDLQKRKPPINAGRGIDVTKSEEDKFREAAVDAILLRSGIQLEKAAEGATELRGMSLRDMAIETHKDLSNLQRMSSSDLYSEILRRDNSSDQFMAIMDNTINKAYKQGYETVQATFEAFCSEGTLSDFKISKHEYLAGPAGELERIPENGELPHDLPQDGLMPTRHLDTYGKQFTMTRQAFINDDIGYITTIPMRYAKAAKTSINKQVYEVLVGNGVIYDGSALFGANHNNDVIKHKGAPTSEAIQAMIVGLSSQKNQFDEAIAIRPACIMVPVGYGFAVQTVLESTTISTPGNTQAANPMYKYRNQIKVAEDPTINALAAKKGLSKVPWFMAGEKMDCSGIQVDYLNGNKLPTIRRSERVGTLGLVWDVFMDWGITVMDYRSLMRNEGDAIDLEL